MSFEALRKEIIESAEKEAEAILAEAREKAEKILREAEERAAAIKSRKRAEVESQLKTKMEVAKAVKRLEGKRLVYSKIMELINMVEDKSIEKLKSLRNNPSEYASIWKRFVEKGLSELGVDEAKIFYSSDDADFINSKELKSALKGFNLEFVDSGERFLGGFIMSDPDEKVFYIATFDGRLREVMDKDLYVILNILRGEE